MRKILLVLCALLLAAAITAGSAGACGPGAGGTGGGDCTESIPGTGDSTGQ